jgi:hypothetical protein
MSALTLQQARDHLNISNAVSDVEIQATIDAAEAILAQSVGPLSTLAARTDRLPGGTKLVLPIAPVISVTSVTSPDGSLAVDLTTVTKNLPAGVLYFTDNATWFTSSVYDVTYVPGRATLPGDLLLAVKEMVRHLWMTQRGSGASRSGGGDMQAPGYLMPYRVQELLEPYRLVTVGAA